MLKRHFHSRARIAALAALAGGVLAVLAPDRGRGDDLTAALAEAVEEEVLLLGQPVVFREPSALAYGEAVFLGIVDEGEPADVYYAAVRAEDGQVLDVRDLRNLTRTSSADEGLLTVFGADHVAFGSRVDGRFDAIVVLGLRGERAELTADWPRRARLQNAVSNYQAQGRRRGFDRRRYALEVPSGTLSFAAEGERLVAGLEQGEVVLQAGDDTPTAGAELVRFEAPAKGMPGTLTWVVDTVRSLPFVGPEPIAWLEHRVFALKDALQRAYYTAFGEPDTEQEVADELGLADLSEEATRRRAELAVTDPELGWPPAQLDPVVRSPARGEGEWVAVVDDPFVRSYPGAPPAFYTTFLQVDPDRPFTRVYVVTWDPRAVQLRVMTGTREPESATGATGSGMVPRDQLGQLVAGFNGGFQSLHGEFGMMSEGRVYLPPKPWAATVAVYRDGRVAMGSWTDPPEGVRHYREQWAVRQIPETMVEFRQNLTSVVEGDRINPWRRWYWGAAPRGDDEQAYIDRSGICLTSEGFFAYFWGKSMGADELGEAMRATRCVRGIHLDMNQRHTAFEFYNVLRRSEAPDLPRRPSRDFEFEVDVPRAREWTARGRLLARSMTPMRFPRYVRQDPRDFFYLTLKPVLPGPALRRVGEGALELSASGLPHGGWPPALAAAEDGGTHFVRIDGSRVIPQVGIGGREEAPRVLAYLTGAARAGARRLVRQALTVGNRFAIVEQPGRSDETVFAGPAIDSSHGAGLGVDGEGFWLYVEGPRAAATFEAMGIDAIGLGPDQRLAYQLEGMTAGPDAFERDVAVESSLVLVANERPASEVLFPDVEPRPYMYWGRMQDTRVRYFRGEGPPRFVAPDPEEDDASP